MRTAAPNVTPELPDRTRGFRVDLLMQRGLTQTTMQILHDLLHESRMRSRKDEQIPGAFFRLRKNDKVLGKKFRFASDA
jgi:hypothetical protein